MSPFAHERVTDIPEIRLYSPGRGTFSSSSPSRDGLALEKVAKTNEGETVGGLEAGNPASENDARPASRNSSYIIMGVAIAGIVIGAILTIYGLWPIIFPEQSPAAPSGGG